MTLPKEFELRMQDMLGEAYPAFLCSCEDRNVSALRVNALKGTREEFLSKTPFAGLREVLWESNGFYCDSGQQAGKHPLHEAGVYYIQEPSAMAPAACLDARPGERVLDLCAAPGGKTTQIASSMKNEGLLVCNEIHPARVKILSENVERMGIRNALVTNETPGHLAELFGECFDRVLVDAPCSGEGMFRKNPAAIEEWSPENVRLCAARQDEILDCADAMLRAGGRLVYSTCTFAPAENEGSVARFLERHPAYELVEVPLLGGMTAGVPQWAHYGADADIAALRRTVRLFPHLAEGEGHYLAVLQKAGSVPEGYRRPFPGGTQKGLRGSDVKEFVQFQEEALRVDLSGGRADSLLRYGDRLYLMPEDMPALNGIKALRPGLQLGTLKRNRFEPSHALALALRAHEVRHTMELYDGSDARARAYLSGQTLTAEGEKGWHLLTYKGYSIGWGKLSGQIMKNHYPKGLRKG
ncbi:MAG: RsmB/NOP family class I SAM-dependent RNA methyltransferase [Roseburia sp.]|nr:RsmB/NOP family class I SAM-dependent RNA methyltransferase [Roseburia sp.]